MKINLHMRTTVLIGSCALAMSSLPCRAAALVTLPNGSDVYNTGVDLAGGVDKHYTMTVNPFNGSGNVFVTSAGYLSGNNADSAWVSPSGTNVHAPESIYHIATEVDLTGIDLTGFSLNGYWISDNQGLDILINGASTGQANTGSHTQLPDMFEGNAFTLDSAGGLVSGLNTITFVWGNGPAGGAGSQNPNPIHVRVQFTEYLIMIPGDLNSDGFVGIDDLNLVLANWNQNVPPADPLADPSGDGFVGIDDLNEVLGNWNAGTPPEQPAAIPEPGSAVIVLLLATGSFMYRRRAVH